MSPYTQKNKIKDVEHPTSSSILGRDILGVNANNPFLSKSTIDLQDEELNTDYSRNTK